MSVMMLRPGPGPTIRRWPRVMTLMMSGRTGRPDLHRPPRSTARPRSIHRVSVPGSRARPSRRHGPGLLPTPSTSGRVTGPWWVVTSLRSMTLSAPITPAWSMAFRSVGPGRHWAAVGPGSSHHRDAGWKGLLLVTGPGRLVGRLCLRSLRRGGWFRSLLRLGRPIIPAFGSRDLNSFFWRVDFNGVVHLLTFLRCPSCRRHLAFPLLLSCFLQCFPRFGQPVLAHITRSLCAKRQSLIEAALLASEVGIAPSSVVRATGKLQLRFRGRWPMTWLRHLV